MPQIRVSVGKKLFLTSLKQTCNAYLYWRTGNISMLSTCSELTPHAPISDGRMERTIQPCICHDFHAWDARTKNKKVWRKSWMKQDSQILWLPKIKKHDFSLNRTVSSLENIFCFLGVVVCASRVPDSHLFGRCPKSIVEIIYNEELPTTLPCSRKLWSNKRYKNQSVT